MSHARPGKQCKILIAWIPPQPILISSSRIGCWPLSVSPVVSPQHEYGFILDFKLTLHLIAAVSFPLLFKGLDKEVNFFDPSLTSIKQDKAEVDVEETSEKR